MAGQHKFAGLCSVQAHCDVFAARMLDCTMYRYNVMYSRKKTRVLSCLLYTVVYRFWI